LEKAKALFKNIDLQKGILSADEEEAIIQKLITLQEEYKYTDKEFIALLLYLDDIVKETNLGSLRKDITPKDYVEYLLREALARMASLETLGEILQDKNDKRIPAALKILYRKYKLGDEAALEIIARYHRARHDKALITGIAGQDASYISEWLLKIGFKVVGIEPEISDVYLKNVLPLKDKIKIIKADLRNKSTLKAVLKREKPNFIFSLGALSHVGRSFRKPQDTIQATGLGVINLLEAIQEVYSLEERERIRFYQASTSELFGEVQETPQTELTVFKPLSPYAEAKNLAHQYVRVCRYLGLFTAAGILFNHESERRPTEFVTRKVTDAAARIKLGLSTKVVMGNLGARRDWGYSPEYVEGMWLILQQDEPSDYLLATGETHTIKELLEATFSYLGLDYNNYIKEDTQYTRPRDVQLLIGNPQKARILLGWKPTIKFRELIELMAKADLKRYEWVKSAP
jgi:GDPmannose 4,6-dehydratase